MLLMFRETFVNRNEDRRFGESGWQEVSLSRGDLFRQSQSEYGRCIGPMYRDQKNGPPVEIGWVFEGRDRYDGERRTYLREVWVEVREVVS